MQRKDVSSSMIRSIGHDSATSVLEIEFNSGAVWQYFDFPEGAWYEFESTASHGKYFHTNIKGSYPESQVG